MVTECIFLSDNNLSITLQHAGAIYQDSGRLTSIDSTYNQNTAFSNGGVLYMKNGSLFAADCSFSENTAVKVSPMRFNYLKYRGNQFLTIILAPLVDRAEERCFSIAWTMLLSQTRFS